MHEFSENIIRSHKIFYSMYVLIGNVFLFGEHYRSFFLISFSVPCS